MFHIILQKMKNNFWMSLCLLIGSVIMAAMVSSIPIYTDGILTRMVVKDLERFQQDEEIYPGTYKFETELYYITDPKERTGALKHYDKEIRNKWLEEVGLPTVNSSLRLIFNSMTTKPDNEGLGIIANKVHMEAIEGLEEHVKLLRGRMFTGKPDNGVYEVVVAEGSMNRNRMYLNETYTVTPANKGLKAEPIKIKVVGIIGAKDPEDPFWLDGLAELDQCFLIDYGLSNKDFIEKNSDLLLGAHWNIALDYHRITLDDIPHILDTYEENLRWVKGNGILMKMEMPFIPALKVYVEREKNLKFSLWVLMVPVLLMLSLYIFMVSRLVVDNEENEIAVVKSRGASRGQVFRIYFGEGLFFSAAGFLAGPPLGLLLCRILGSSNGFLEFVRRTGLPLKIDTKVYMYATASLLLFMVSMLIPVYASSRRSIVEYKVKISRKVGKPFWSKFFIDLLLIAVSLYGFYRYNNAQNLLAKTNAELSDIGMDPSLFLFSMLFALGAGLLFLRLYPYLVQGVFWLGRHIWSPVLYASFVQVGRSRGLEHFLMIFIMLALSVGIFSANAARTINRNLEEKIRYMAGADIRIMGYWPKTKTDVVIGEKKIVIGPAQPPPDPAIEEPVKYQEPLFDNYARLSEIRLATKVLTDDTTAAMTDSGWVSNVRSMGIIPEEFGKVAWFRDDLSERHWYELLNKLTRNPRSFILSRSFQEKHRVKLGDTIAVRWENKYLIEGVVAGFTDYWPGYNPDGYGNGPQVMAQDLVVMNMSYIQNILPVRPYMVWMKKLPGATDSQVDDDINDKALQTVSRNYTDHDVIEMKNDPFIQGTNGSLTLGFIVSMTISVLGFLIFWIISIQKRVLQFGIFRAMGLSLGKVIGMIACEQLFISGAAILAGIVIGGMTSDLFVPLLKMVYGMSGQVLPFKVIATRQDYLKIYALFSATLALGLMALARLISGIKIDQAVKLGED